MTLKKKLGKSKLGSLLLVTTALAGPV